MSDEFAAAPRFRLLGGAAAALLRGLMAALTLLGSLWALELHHYLPWSFFT